MEASSRAARLSVIPRARRQQSRQSSNSCRPQHYNEVRYLHHSIFSVISFESNDRTNDQGAKQYQAQDTDDGEENACFVNRIGGFDILEKTGGVCL